MNKSPYENLPTTAFDWESFVKPAQEAYWAARQDGRSENEAVLYAIDMAYLCLRNTGIDLP